MNIIKMGVEMDVTYIIEEYTRLFVTSIYCFHKNVLKLYQYDFPFIQ